jgi:hypothetical protein
METEATILFQMPLRVIALGFFSYVRLHDCICVWQHRGNVVSLQWRRGNASFGFSYAVSISFMRPEYVRFERKRFGDARF